MCAASLRLFACIALLFPLKVSAEDSCSNGAVLGFFNGVNTKEVTAKLSAIYHLPGLYGYTTPAGDPITYELFQNHTQAFADFVETFDQRLQEQNGLLAVRFELFFSAAMGEGF